MRMQERVDLVSAQIACAPLATATAIGEVQTAPEAAAPEAAVARVARVVAQLRRQDEEAVRGRLDALK